MSTPLDPFDFNKPPFLSLIYPLTEVGVNGPLRVLNDRLNILKNMIGSGTGNGFHFIGTLPDQNALDGIDTSSLPENSAYFVGSAIAVWNTEQWVVSPSLQGPPGVGVGEGDDLELVNAYQEAKG
jgi:hypothetical protein